MHLNCLHSLISTTKGITCHQAVNVLRKRVKNFHVSQSDISKSVSFTVITEDDKEALIKIESVFSARLPFRLSMRSSQTGAFRRLSKHVFRGR